jgi:hypothetical protein
MPHIQIDAAVAGPIKINYHISTPTETSAESIDPSRPTILFLHGNFIVQYIFVGTSCCGRPSDRILEFFNA